MGCNWTLISPPNTRLLLDIESFDITESGNEVICYDGQNAQSSYIKNWNLNYGYVGDTIEAQGNTFHIRLKSSSSKFNIQFKIKYSFIGSNFLIKP